MKYIGFTLKFQSQDFDPRKWEFLFFLEMKTWVNLSVLVVFSSCKPAADQTPIRGMESDSPGVTNLWRYRSCCQIWKNFQHHPCLEVFWAVLGLNRLPEFCLSAEGEKGHVKHISDFRSVTNKDLTLFAPICLSISRNLGGAYLPPPSCIQVLVWVGVPNIFGNDLSGNDLPS